MQKYMQKYNRQRKENFRKQIAEEKHALAKGIEPKVNYILFSEPISMYMSNIFSK